MSRPLPRTVVVHHRSGIGDLIWHIPYLRAMAARSRDGKLSLIARPSCRAAEVLAAEPWLEEVIEYDRRPRAGEQRSGEHDSLLAQWGMVQQLRARKFDRIYIFSSRARYAALALLAGIPERAGFGFGLMERLLLNRPPHIRPYAGSGNWVYPEATAFAQAQGLVEGPIVPRMAVLPASLKRAAQELAAFPGPRISFSIGTSEARKHWGNARFAALASALVARGGSVILLGGPAEQAVAAAIVGAVDAALQARILVSAQPSIQRSAALLRQCDFCVGNDTGVLNMAVANGIPALGLFGATPPLAHDPLLHSHVGSGMDDIPVEAVLARLEELLTRVRPQPVE
ncbi:MAG: glycosyltransferase family 9 protein [Rhodocyclales bacterium]|nr:glycosyltransferase family 9 protein [Rhodocyclales bacterium]